MANANIRHEVFCFTRYNIQRILGSPKLYLMENPDILILDEPFNGLDKDSVKEMRSLLLSLRDAGKLILLASHNPLDISLLCDSAFEIDRGMLFPFEITKSQNVVE